VQSLLALWLFRRFHLSVEVAGTFFFAGGLLGAASQLASGRLAARIGLVETMVYTHLPSNGLLVAAAWPAVRLPFAPGRWAVTLLAVLLAAAMRFFISFTTGLLAFWTTRATAIMELHAGVSLFLAGRIAPLALLPPAVAGVAGVLWFRSMLAFPVDLLTGTVHGTDAIVRGLAAQVVWLAVWVGAYRLAWIRGLRRYGAVGG